MATSPASSSAASPPSLRRRLLGGVLVPLALTWLLGSGLMLGIAYYFAQQALDRSLLDDAYALAANVSNREGKPVLNLSEREIGTVLFDQSERVFFSLLDARGEFVAGHGGLRIEKPRPEVLYEFADQHTRGLDLRTVTLRRSQPTEFYVVVGQTVNSRNLWLRQLVVDTLVPQLILLALLGWWLRHVLGRELRPLIQLQHEVDNRHGNDLSPVAHKAPSKEVQRLADAINRLLVRIDAGVRSQREFAGNVAHELRTPLAGIRSLAEHGLSQQDPAQWRIQLQRVIDSQERASHLVDQLLALALANEARDSVQLEPIALDAMVRDVLLRQMPMADARGIDLGASGLEEPIWAWGQLALLEGALSNLLDNAMRYGKPLDAGVVPQITVSLQSLGDEVVLIVADNGPGLDVHQREEVMGRGAQGQAGRSMGLGAGLGLSIVEQYVELLEGRIELVSESGLCVRMHLKKAHAP